MPIDRPRSRESRPLLAPIVLLGALTASCGSGGENASSGAGQGGNAPSGSASSGQSSSGDAASSSTASSSSSSGTGGCSAAKDCDDSDPCTDDVCSQGACGHTPTSCDDNDVCTADTCDAKRGCAHTPQVYFTEGFETDTKAWSLGSTWQIGAATASSGQVIGNADPAEDHTATSDNGIAGVFIGGNTVPGGTFPGPIHYLTSPIIDLGAVEGPVVLQFFRWLNSDATPFMQNFVEVFDGSTWVQLWASKEGVTDSAWTDASAGADPTQFEVTAHKSGKFQVRFGYQLQQVGVANVSGWNLDDVRLVPAASCP